MTPRTRQVLAAIDTLTRQAGYPPTVREIGQAVGLAWWTSWPGFRGELLQ